MVLKMSQPCTLGVVCTCKSPFDQLSKAMLALSNKHTELRKELVCCHRVPAFHNLWIYEQRVKHGFRHIADKKSIYTSFLMIWEWFETIVMFYGSTNNDNKIIRNIILQRKHLENISFDFVHMKTLQKRTFVFCKDWTAKACTYCKNKKYLKKILMSQ